jgi:hypothetical protein
LATPKEQKRRVVYKTGHDIPWNEAIQESLDWLDRYLGPVRCTSFKPAQRMCRRRLGKSSCQEKWLSGK